MINESLIARIYTVDKDGYDRVGTGYPVAPDLLVTALHVVSYPEQDKGEGIFIIWDECGQDWPEYDTEKEQQLSLDAIVYDGSNHSTDYDVAILKCKTPLTDRVSLLSVTPPHNTNFLCRGYPLAGLHNEKPTHDALRFSGNTEGNDTGLHFELTTRNAPVANIDNTLNNWSGLSGSPLLINNQLAGVITTNYRTVENRLFAVSFPYLLKNNDEFRELLRPTQKVGYKEARQQDLSAHLDSLNSGALPCCEDLIRSFKQDHSVCISDLSDKLSTQLSHLDDVALQKLLSLLLTQVEIPGCEKSANHVYDLKVGTQLLSEVAISAIYEVEPSFQAAETGVAGLKGEFVIPASLTETGFEAAKQAEEQARVVSHAVYKNIHDKELANIHSGKAVTRYKGLNSHLANMRGQAKIYRFELDQEDASDAKHPLMSEATRNYLKESLLPELLIAFYGEDFAFEAEPDLESQVGIYMQKLKR